MITYTIFGLLISIFLIFLFKKVVDLPKEKFKNLFKILIFFILAIITIILIRFNPSFFSLPAFLILLFKWRNLIFFLKKIIFPNRSNFNRSHIKMDKKKALEILGLDENATEKEILKSYHDLMKKNHPDLGGSSWITTQLNQAKDTLLG